MELKNLAGSPATVGQASAPEAAPEAEAEAAGAFPIQSLPKFEMSHVLSFGCETRSIAASQALTVCSTGLRRLLSTRRCQRVVQKLHFLGEVTPLLLFLGNMRFHNVRQVLDFRACFHALSQCSTSSFRIFVQQVFHRAEDFLQRFEQECKTYQTLFGVVFFPNRMEGLHPGFKNFLLKILAMRANFGDFGYFDYYYRLRNFEKTFVTCVRPYWDKFWKIFTLEFSFCLYDKVTINHRGGILIFCQISNFSKIENLKSLTLAQFQILVP